MSCQIVCMKNYMLLRVLTRENAILPISIVYLHSDEMGYFHSSDIPLLYAAIHSA